MSSPQQPGSARTIGVVVPNFNHAAYLGQCLHSIETQTRPPDEVTIVDDASTDDSVALIESFLARHPTWRLIRHARRGGAVAALNEGLAMSASEWIVFLGADDFLLPGFLAAAARAATASPHAGLVCACVAINGRASAPAIRPLVPPASAEAYISPDAFRAQLARADNFFLGTVTMYARRKTIELGGFDERLGPFCDGVLARRLAARFGYCFLPAVHGVWRIHGTNYSASTLAQPEKVQPYTQRVREVFSSDQALFPAAYDETTRRRILWNSRRLVAVAREAPAAARASALTGRERGFATAAVRRLLTAGRAGQAVVLVAILLRLRPFSASTLLLGAWRRGRIAARFRRNGVPPSVERSAASVASRNARPAGDLLPKI